jgi:hypothetical protein
LTSSGTGHVALVDAEAHLERQRKSGVSPSTFCVCLTAKRAMLRLAVPAVLDLELGVAGLLDPLLEEPVEALAGGVLDGAARSRVSTEPVRCLRT